MGTSPTARRWSTAVAALGAALVLVHVGHALGEDESLRTVVFGMVVPTVVSLGVLAGGVWLRRSEFGAAATRRVGAWCAVGVATLAVGTVLTILYQRSHGVIVADQAFVVAGSASFGALVGLVVGVYDAQKQRQQRAIRERERTLNDLHTTTRRLVRTSDRQDVAEHAVRAARDVLGMPINACWLYDETEDALVPVASTDEATELLGELPTYTGGESLSWEAFRTGEVMTFDDVRSAEGLHNSETPIRSEIVLPLGDHGVMNVGSAEPGAFDQADLSMIRILAANTRTALERADRERELADTREQTKRLNRQLSVLNRVLRHDIRNSANVIRGHADLLAEGTERSTEAAATVREQATELVELGERARDVERVMRSEGHEREAVDVVAAVEAQLERVREEYPAVDARGPDVEECRAHAHPRIESAIGNVVENAVEHNDRETPRVEVSVSRTEDDRVEVRIADDGPGIPESEVAVLERGYETPLEHASGLGLWLVNWLVTASGGDVRFEENDPRGSVVRLRLDAANADERAGAVRAQRD